MIKLYTIQLANWRLAKERGIPLLDTTVKSGNTAFSPTWSMLENYRTGDKDWGVYTAAFERHMQVSEIINYAEWDALTKYKSVALACYCAPGKNCHRRLLIPRVLRFLNERGLQAEYLGEIQ